MARILVIDDHDTLREGMAVTLTRSGHTVTAARSGTDGVSAYKKTPFDLVVTDLKMDGMDGIAVTRTLKAHDPAAVVMVVTAFGTIETAVQAMQQGAYDFITKPFTPDVLRAKVEKGLELSSTRRQVERLSARTEAFESDAALAHGSSSREARWDSASARVSSRASSYNSRSRSRVAGSAKDFSSSQASSSVSNAWCLSPILSPWLSTASVSYADRWSLDAAARSSRSAPARAETPAPRKPDKATAQQKEQEGDLKAARAAGQPAGASSVKGLAPNGPWRSKVATRTGRPSARAREMARPTTAWWPL